MPRAAWRVVTETNAREPVPQGCYVTYVTHQIGLRVFFENISSFIIFVFAVSFIIFEINTLIDVFKLTI